MTRWISAFVRAHAANPQFVLPVPALLRDLRSSCGSPCAGREGSWVSRPGIWWIGSRLNRSGSDVRILQIHPQGVRLRASCAFERSRRADLVQSDSDWTRFRTGKPSGMLRIPGDQVNRIKRNKRKRKSPDQRPGTFLRISGTPASKLLKRRDLPKPSTVDNPGEPIRPATAALPRARRFR